MTTSSPPEDQLSSIASAAPAVPRLRGNLNTAQLVFTVLAFNAPLVIVIGFIPVLVGDGNGIGAPVAIIACAAILGLFAVGFTTMSRHLPNPGGFYAYITAGLGKATGLGSSFIAVVCYYFSLVGTYAFAGLVLNSLVHDTYHGPALPWWIYSALMWVVTSVLGYFRLDLSAKVLSFFLAGELTITTIYDLCVAVRGGANGLPLTSFTPHAIFSGSIGLALMFAMGMFGGFEATAIFRDEVRRPARTVPRATYLVIALVAVLYSLTTWLFIDGTGVTKVVAAAIADPTGSVKASIALYAGHWAVDVALVLVNTSCFATLLSAHNILSRYMYNLSADRILHRSLSGVHAQHGSPHRASIMTSILALLGLLPFVLLRSDPNQVYTVLVGVYAYTFIALLFITCIAVPVYLHRHREPGVTLWKRLIAPALALIGLAVALLLSTRNFALLIGGSQSLANAMFALVYGVFVVGVVMALVYRRKRPDVYARIGRQE
ncbi:MAG TPA: APC family permease [Pseudonocardiaceae bacterium]|jgi:amino acid transporter|nr:APC family permease [Pseudonocardiaceae bacterium]